MNQQANSAISEPQNIDTSYLRPAKARCLLAEWHNYADRTGKLALRRLSDVNISAMGQIPGIAHTDNRLIDDCDFYAECVNDTESVTHIDGTVLYAGYLRKSWGHFLMNSTARLWPIFTAGTHHFDKVIFFAEDDAPTELSGNFKEFLSLAGILDKCEILPRATYHFDDITVGEISLEIGCYYSNEFSLPFEAARKAALAATAKTAPSSPGGYGIILSRSNWNNNDRTQININRIESIFTSAGYRAVSPESIPLGELIRQMHNAGEIVSFSGSTAHNILFCDRKPLILLERCAANNVYQTGIMKMQQNQVTLIDCFFQPMLTSSTDNLTIYGATEELKHYIGDRSLPMPVFNMHPRREFSRYLAVYRKHHGHGPGINEWEWQQAPAIYEAYFASRPRYGRYIDRRYPILWSDFCSPRVMARLLKDTLRRRQ
ncbi:MAG: glycosyltransferase family 61 protein [Muribaculaceae bacterium]|nr:glycosyltransferase family 61 protein [Muribaculaceae bacterium]